MRVDRHLLNWGVFFIFLGAVPLAVGEGLLGRPAVSEAWRLWPLLVVALGIVVLLSRTPARLVGGALVAACFGLILGSLLAASPSLDLCRGGTGTSQTRSGTFDGPAQVDLQIRCGTANVTSADGNAWTTTTSNSGAGSVDATAGRLSVRTANGGDWWFDGSSGDWQIVLPRQGQLQLTASIDAATADIRLGSASVGSATMSVNAGTGHLDLSGTAIQQLTVTVNAGSATVTLPAGADLQATLSINVGSLRLCAPADLGLQIRLRQSLGGDNLASAGLIQSGGVWTSTSAAPAHRADLQITNNLGSLTLVRGGC